jgi:hypothetical protein
VVRAGAGRSSCLLDAFHAEVTACYEGAREAAECGMGHVVIETDSLMLKQALQSDDFRLAATGGLIYELKMLIHSSFISVSIVHVPRSCNSVAHALAAGTNVSFPSHIPPSPLLKCFGIYEHFGHVLGQYAAKRGDNCGQRSRCIVTLIESPFPLKKMYKLGQRSRLKLTISHTQLLLLYIA